MTIVARTYEQFSAEWRALRTAGVRVREVACAGAARTLLLAEYGPTGAPEIHLTAGVHGDEPAAPWALLGAVRDGLLDDRFAYRIWPCTNPSGYVRRSRENAEGEDINRSFNRGGTTPESRAILTANRDRRFLLALDLHEDYEADGFYCYEADIAGAPFGTTVIAAMDDAGLAVQTIPENFDLGYQDPSASSDAARLERGRVIYDVAAEMALFSGWPLTLALLRRAARHAMTFETPRALSWETRIAMHRVALSAVLTGLAQRNGVL